MAQLLPVETCDLVIFGGTGDLAMRKLIPAMYHRTRDGQITADSRIISVGRGDMSHDQFLSLVHEALQVNLNEGELDAAVWHSFKSRLSYVHADATDTANWTSLCEVLSDRQDRTRVVYLATAPHLFGPIAAGFRSNDLINDNTRIVLEKPVGHDLASAHAINDEVGRCFEESQIFRIDHYLGKETVQNLLALRFGNSLFEPLWRRGVVDHVQITVAEDLGAGSRTEFYNDTGALRDMVQNHLLQLVCLVAMEAPSSLGHDSVRDEKLKVLRALKPITDREVESHTVRGRYTPGAINGQAVSGYSDELGDEPSNAETFVALKLEIENWRWSGVPFYLRTGKRLKTKHSEIVIQFGDVPHSIFPDLTGNIVSNRLSIRLQPDEGVKLSVMAKEPGPGGFALRPVSLDLSFEEAFGIRYPDSYERLLMEVLRGNPALFMRRDEVEAAWQWIDWIIAGWRATDHKINDYVAGTWGPVASSMLLDRDSRSWYPEN
jgi:glucose-6-phosphate 1-dehydrogenase